MNRRVASFTGALALFLSMPIFSSASAAGAEITQIGWWTQRPGATEQPDGGFEIALAPTGPISEAALRIQVDAPQLNSALLELIESQAAGAEVASVVACPTTDTWAPANPGAWTDAPTPNCNTNVALSRRFSGEWVADIAELLRPGTVSIVLFPMSHPDTQGAPLPYQLVFSAAKLSASAPAAPAPASPPPPTTFGSQPPPPEEPRGETEPPDEPAEEPAPSPVVVGSSDEPEEEDGPPLAADTTEDGGNSRPWWRIAILVPVAALIGGGSVFARRLARDRGWAG